ncbi:MAG: hypothetical protein NAOJABEB_02962 [Steroidobacteraceae bacterium]|nr:hypothetical protein [Steroidobacteraceae bacterium]
MQAVWRFTVPGPPVPYTRMVRGDRSKRAQKYRAYRELVAWHARAAGMEPIAIASGPVSLMVECYVDGQRHRRWDATNVLKGIEDALLKLAYTDDNQVTSAQVRIWASEDGEEYVSVWVGRIA